MKYEIYYDQDEVMNLLAKHMISIYNKEYNDNYDWQRKTTYHFGDRDNLKADTKYFIDMMSRPGVFLDPEMEPDTDVYMKKFIESGHEVYIVTYPQWNEFCPVDKTRWIRKHVPWFNLNNLCMCKRKEKMAAPNRILLDDNVDNLENWRKAGGIAVAYNKPWNKEWDGPRVSSHKEFFEYVTMLEIKAGN